MTIRRRENGAKVYWTGTVPMRDDFDNPILNQFVDGRTTMGPWALMSMDSFNTHGVGLGIGMGQHYVKQGDGRWLKVNG
jgi:hypothetical protein